MQEQWLDFRIALGAFRYHEYLGPRTFRISSKTLIKRGEEVDLHEAETMRYVAKNTSIPVPTVKWAFHSKSNGRTYIQMEYVRGCSLDVVWTELSRTAQDNVIRQLKAYVAELRSLPCPNGDGAVCSVTGGYLRDVPRAGFQTLFGPFTTCDDFHTYLRANHTLELLSRRAPGVQTERVVTMHSRPFAHSYLTHGDLAPRNILVDKEGSGKVVAVLDWDASGWFPDYWEYNKAMWWPGAHVSWVKRIAEFAGEYKEEHRADCVLYNICACE